MILTGKAKDDFNKWKIECKRLSSVEVLEFRFLSNVVQNSMIIEWLDSVGIYIEVACSPTLEVGVIRCNFNSYVSGQIVINNHPFGWVNSRAETTEQAIITANEIYNQKNK